MTTIGNMFLVSGLSILSNILGFISQLILASAFGTSQEMDAYFSVLSIPMILTGIAPVVFAAVILPSLAVLKQEETRRQKLIYSLFGQTGVLCLLVMAVGWFLSPFIVDFFFPSFPTALRSDVITASRFIWGASGVSLLVSYFYAVRHADKLFGRVAFVGLVPASMIILSVSTFSSSLGIRSIALGFFIGTILQALILLPDTFKSLNLLVARPAFGPEIRSILKRIGPVILSLLPFTMPGFIAMYWAVGLPEGSMSFLGYSQGFAGLLSVAIGYGIAVVSLPDMAEKYASGTREAAYALVERRLRYVFLLTTAGAILLIVLRLPILEMAYQQGNFSATSVQGVAAVLPWYLLGAVGIACLNLLRAFYYAMDNVRSLAILGVIVPIVYFAAAGVLSQWLSYVGIGLTYAIISMMWLMAALFFVPGRRYGLWSLSLAGFMAKIVIVSSASFFLANWVGYNFFLHISDWFGIMISAGLLVISFIFLSRFVFGIPEVRALMAWPRRILMASNKGK